MVYCTLSMGSSSSDRRMNSFLTVRSLQRKKRVEVVVCSASHNISSVCASRYASTKRYQSVRAKVRATRLTGYRQAQRLDR